MLTHEKLNIPREIVIEKHLFTINIDENLAEDPYGHSLILNLRSKSTPETINISISRRELRSNTIDMVNLKLNEAIGQLRETVTEVHFEL
jgi:hypothetical protein